MIHRDWNLMTDMEVVSDAGKRLKLLRMAENLTQQMLAEQTGLNRSTIRDIETGKSVNISSIIPILRRLHLLEKFNECIPDGKSSPVLALRQSERKRVRLSSKKR